MNYINSDIPVSEAIHSPKDLKFAIVWSCFSVIGAFLCTCVVVEHSVDVRLGLDTWRLPTLASIKNDKSLN